MEMVQVLRKLNVSNLENNDYKQQKIKLDKIIDDLLDPISKWGNF